MSPEHPTAVVVEDAAPGEVPAIATDVASSGMQLVHGWLVAAPDTVCMGVVADEADAQHAVLAALAGATIVVDATADRDVVDRLCDDLRRLGPLDHRVGAQTLTPKLGPDEQALVARLLVGETLGQAAAALHLSRRTADRRLATARRAFGVATTAELLAAASRSRVRPSS